MQDSNPVLSGTQSLLFGTTLATGQHQYGLELGPLGVIFLQAAKRRSLGTPQRPPSPTPGSEAVENRGLPGVLERTPDASTMTGMCVRMGVRV